MASPIERLQTRTGTPNERARVLELADGDTDEVLDALSSKTGRRAYRALFEEPATTSELADRLDTSVQNAHHHLSNLREAELVESIDTVYSRKGNEMTVYGPASDPIVFVGDDERFPAVERSLTGVVTGLGLLAVASLLVQWAAERLLATGAGPADSAAPASTASPDPTSGEMLSWMVVGALQPGVLFFTGCLLIAAIVTFVGRR